MALQYHPDKNQNTPEATEKVNVRRIVTLLQTIQCFTPIGQAILQFIMLGLRTNLHFVVGIVVSNTCLCHRIH